MAIDAKTLAAAKKYTKETVEGAGAIKGKNCTIKSIIPMPTIHETEVTFAWYEDGASLPTLSKMMVPDGAQGPQGKQGETGLGIKSLNIDSNRHLIVTYDDDTTQDAGLIPGGGGPGDIDTELDPTSTNAVENRAIAIPIAALQASILTKANQSDISRIDLDISALQGSLLTKASKSEVPTKVSDLNNDSGFVTNTVNNLINYYLKSEVYTKADVDTLISAVSSLDIQVVAALPTTDISRTTIYLLPKSSSETSNVYDEYINLDGTTAGWEKIGDTQIDLSNYVTNDDLTAALADYTTTANLTTLLAAKQDTISDLSTIRSGAAAGATAYQKPSTGIPKTDLASAVQSSLDKADTALQSHQSLANYYQTGDTAETDLQDEDYIPFYDASASAKRKSLWSNIKAKLKSYFDGIYATVNGHTMFPTPSASLTESSVVGAIKGSTNVNSYVPSLFSVQKWSNEKRVRRTLSGASSIGSTGIGTWDDSDTPDETDWWYDAAFIIPDDADDLDIDFKFDPTGSLVAVGGYILDTTTGKLCVKFANTVDPATTKFAVDITYTRNEVI